MPLFDLDIDVDEFLSTCSKREINQIIDALIEDGYLNKSSLPTSKNVCIAQQEHIDSCTKLVNNYYQLSIEECEILKKISNRF